MRRIITFQWLTADGHSAGPDGNLEWVVPDDEQARAAAAGIASIDTVLLGGLATSVKLELAESRRLPSGDVLLRYVRAPGGR